MTNTNNYSFNFFTTTNTTANNTNANPGVKKPTPGQVKYYFDLCKQKKVVPEDTSTFTYDTISAEIQRLLSYYPPSESQINLITDKIDNVKSLVSRLKFTEEQQQQFESDTENVICVILNGLLKDNLNINSIIKDLTGGKDGTASKLIEGLIGVERQFNDIQPPTDNQLQLIVSMFLCPDVDFENHGISRRIELEEGLWRKPSPQEFAEIIQSTFTSAIASQFIDQYRGAFHEWKKTRIRPEQLRYIMQLESYMGNDNTPGVVEHATMIDGTVVDVTTSKKEYVGGSCFTVHTEEQLIHFTIEQASQYIDQLKAELDRKEDSSFIESEIDDTTLRNIFDLEDYIENEYQELEDLMYKLESIAGYDDEELHQAVTINLVRDPSPEANVVNRKKIRDFIRDLLQVNAITIYEIMQLTASCQTAQRILLDL